MTPLTRAVPYHRLTAWFLLTAVSLGLVLASVTPGAAATLETIRQRQNINRDWKFKLGDYAGAEVSGYGDTLWNAVNLPHSFSLPYFLSTQFYTGYGWYRRHLIVPPEWGGKRIFIEFEGAFQDAQVYVNGTQIGRHLGGYTGFSYDITSALVTGDNVIAVRLNNSWNAQVAPRAGDHVFSGGLYRDVNLVVVDSLHVTWYGTFATTPTVAANAGASSTVNIKTEVRNDNATSRSCTVKTDIIAPNGVTVATVSSTQTIAANTTVTVDQTTPTIANPQLWHPDHPWLYHALTTISDGATAVDDFDTRFGFRWFNWSASQGFSLNGAHYYFHGANVHQDHAGWGDGVTNAGFRRDVQMVKDAGFNFIRGSHYPKDPAFGDACDELGVLFWSENCFWGIGGGHTDGHWGASAYPTVAGDQAPFDQSVLTTLTDMIRIHRNHPSVVAWSMSNEAFFSDTAALTGMRNLLTSEVALAHQLDPTRPAAIGGAQRPLDSTRIDKIGDIAGYNGDGATQSVFQNSGVPSVVSEYGSPVAVRPGPYDPAWGNLSSQLTNGFPTEYAWRSGQAIWCMFDHGSFAGTNLETMGVVDYFRLPKRAWYWYRNAYKGIAPPVWPVAGTATQLGLAADNTTLTAVDGTDDAQLQVSVLDASGNRLSNTAAVTLTIESGPGEFPTGRSITFTPSGSGDASDIAMRDGWAAIEFRAYQAGSSVIRATSPGLTDATITITSQGSPAFVAGTTPLVASRPYTRFNGTITQPPVSFMTLALNRPTQASSTAPGSVSSVANDGDAATIWLAADMNPNAWWLVQLEVAYQVNRIQLTFPTAGNYRYKIEVSTDGVNYVTAVDQSQTTSTEQTRVATGNFGTGIGVVRVRFTGLPPGLPAGLAEVSVGGGSGLTFNAAQLGGTIIGTAGSWSGLGNVRENAMDGDLTTYFDASNANGAWVGLDLGSQAGARIAKVRYCPRTGNAARMVGGKFQGANSVDFSDAVDLYTITSTPTVDVFTTQEVSNAGFFHYVRYLSPASGSCNVSEIEFYQAAATGATTLYAFENNAADTSGNGNNGTASGITYVTGKVGSKAANFNGTTAYVGSSLATSGDFTVALWVKTTSGSSSGTTASQWWAGKGLVDGDQNGNAADWGTSITNGKFAFGIGAATTATSDVTVLSGASINDNLWHHCVATWTASTGAMAVYVDGTLGGADASGAGVARLSPIAFKLGRVSSGGTSNISLNGALDDVRYYDRVLAGYEITALAAMTAPTTAPSAPASLAATAGDGQVALTWSTSAGAASYAVKRSTVNGSGYVTLNSTANVSYVDTLAGNGATYYYVVVAGNLAGNSGNSPQAAATPLGLPGAPTNLTATAAAEATALSWSAAANATSYTVMRGTAGGGPYAVVQTIPGTNFTDTGLTAGTVYYYVVTATNASGTGAYSGEAFATPLTLLQAWRLANFGTTVNAGNAADSADPDGDGLTNGQEFAAGTDPTNTSSVLKVTDIAVGGGNITVSFPTVPGKTYRVERSDTLQAGSWSVLQDNITGTGGIFRVTDGGAAGQSKRFYRIVIP
ncbi:MAG: discoidin domain-containing protein [Verrucomicrobia bacterium]|nr:discoidin domain-containing protein [Verrucomicrobiota bacterium]